MLIGAKSAHTLKRRKHRKDDVDDKDNVRRRSTGIASQGCLLRQLKVVRILDDA